MHKLLFSSDCGIWDIEIPVCFSVSIKVIGLCEKKREEKAEGQVMS